jgi:hypothetical protein
MPDATEGPPLMNPPLMKWVLMFVGMAGTVACLSLLFLCMRAVMDVGGRCVSGNSGLNLPPCPDGVAGLMIGSIFLGIGFLGLYAFNAVGPNLTWLAWPALFISLGWNFLQYGIDPPGPESGPIWGWLICAVIFIVMGAGPLVIGIAAIRSGRTPGPPVSPQKVRAAVRARTRKSPTKSETAPGGAPDSVLAELERLAELRRDGDLTDAQYEAAKEQLLREGGKRL